MVDLLQAGTLKELRDTVINLFCLQLNPPKLNLLSKINLYITFYAQASMISIVLYKKHFSSLYLRLPAARRNLDRESWSTLTLQKKQQFKKGDSFMNIFVGVLRVI